MTFPTVVSIALFSPTVKYTCQKNMKTWQEKDAVMFGACAVFPGKRVAFFSETQ